MTAPPAVQAASFAIVGAPRTKKTSNRIVQIRGKNGARGFTKILPSEAHEKWFKDAMLQAPRIRRVLINSGFELPITQPVSIAAVFYRERLSGDLCGFMQALADFLQEPRYLRNGKTTRNGAGVIRDDSQVVSWDGSRPAKDAACPRIEVRIQVVGPADGELFAEEEF